MTSAVDEAVAQEPGAVHLGPFELGEPISEGGMGAVYRARHRRVGTEAALKVLLSERAREPEYRRDFHREVQALARLRHPGIATIYDYGTVDEATAERGPEPFVVGAPWMAMQHVEGPILNRVATGWDWRTLSSRILELLDALAHAHAQEVLHRDLKPSNILVPKDGSRLVVVDFGVATVFEDPDRGSMPDSSDGLKGTPKYMAPEQILAEWREQGPWTDCYALGCMIWRILCGGAPFDGETTTDVLKSHLDHRLEPFDPNVAVPEGLEAWLERMMAPRPHWRFRRAADAAWALQKLPGVETDEPPGEGAAGGSEALGTLGTIADVPTTQTDSVTSDETGAVAPGGPVEQSERATSVWRPSIPSDWRRGQQDRSSRVSTAGLGLFGLREPPFVDRDDERDHIWEMLREVDRSGEPRVIVIVGESGAGKSRLVDWMATRAHELGAANILRAVHTSGGDGPNEGLVDMVQRLVRGYGLERGEFYRHLSKKLPTLEETDVDREVDARALTELVHPTDEEADAIDGPRYRFSSPGQKFALLGRLIRRYGKFRPPFVWLDDVQWGERAMSMVEYLLEESLVPPAALMAVTARAEQLADTPELAERIERLTADDRCTRLDLETLQAGDHRAFVERLLPLEPELVDRIARRTEGNPLFARQLVGDLVERRDLEAGDQGFRLAEEASLDLPGDIHELWLRRLTRLVDEFEGERAETLWRAVELAGALGREVHGGEWRAVCAEIGLESVDELLDTLVARGLAERTDRGWAFAHGLLVDSLERHARNRERWKSHHHRCGVCLEQWHGERTRRIAARLADHWIRAGSLERALEPLLQEAEKRWESGDYETAREVANVREDLLDRLSAPEDDPRRLENGIQLALCGLYLGAESSQILEKLREIGRRAENRGEDRLVAKVWLTAGRYLGRQGDYRKARDYARNAARVAGRADEHDEWITALHDWGYAEYLRGNLEEAEQQLSEACRRANEADVQFPETESKVGLAWVYFGRDDAERARQLFGEVLEESREAGYRSLEARALNGLGEVARFAEDADRARTYYGEHREVSRELNRWVSVAVAVGNLAQVELMAERFEVARQLIDEARRLRSEMGEADKDLQVLEMMELAHAAGRGEWSRFDAIAEKYAEGWPESARCFSDHPWLLEMAGDYAARVGESERAGRAWRLARQLWGELDNDAAVQRVGDKLDR